MGSQGAPPTDLGARDEAVYGHIWRTMNHWAPSDTVAAMVTELQAARGAAIRFADLGCGMGRHARFAGGRGAQVTAIDRHPQALKRLSETPEASGIRMVHDDFVRWLARTANGAFDGVVCFDAVHHVSPHPAAVAGVLAQMRRILAPGGELVLALLVDIDYGQGGAPEGRLLLSEVEGDAFLDEAFAHDSVLQAKATRVRLPNALNVDPQTGEMVRTCYRTTRLIRRVRVGSER